MTLHLACCCYSKADITLPTKVHLVKAMVFPVVMYGCESWTMKKAERRRIDAFELWCWRRLLRVPWTARRSNQSILKTNPGIYLEGMMLKLKLQYFGHLMWRTDSLEKTLMLGEIGGRRRGRPRMRWLDGITDSMDMNLSVSGNWWWTGKPGGLRFMGCKESDTTEWLNSTDLNWTEWLIMLRIFSYIYWPFVYLHWRAIRKSCDHFIITCLFIVEL